MKFYLIVMEGSIIKGIPAVYNSHADSRTFVSQDNPK
jgi:hypothetical protein